MISDRERILRFFDKTTPEPNSGCLLWLGGVTPNGYGVFWDGSKFERAHRYALLRAGIPIAPGQHVRHSCDTPSCVNAAHLIAGSRQDNIDDMCIKKRNAYVRRAGTCNPAVKLTELEVTEIRQQPNVALSELGRRYGVSKHAIWAIRHNKKLEDAQRCHVGA